MGVAIYEHNLIVNGISCVYHNLFYESLLILDSRSPADEQENCQEENRIVYSRDLVFLQFSTGEYHPLAHCPRAILTYKKSAYHAGSRRRLANMKSGKYPRLRKTSRTKY